MLDKNKFMKFKYAKYASDKSFKERLQIWFIKDHSKGKPAHQSNFHAINMIIFKLSSSEYSILS